MAGRCRPGQAARPGRLAPAGRGGLALPRRPGPGRRPQARLHAQEAASRGAKRPTRPASSASAASKLPGSPGRDRVGDGPVHGGQLAQFLVRQVADRHDQVSLVQEVADVPGPQPGERQLMTDGGIDRARVDPLGRAGARRDRGHRAGPPPQGGGQVRAGGVGGAHEHHPPGGPARRAASPSSAPGTSRR